MSAKEMLELVGKEIVHNFGGLEVKVKIEDVKIVYGNRRVEISVVGQKSNKIWINY